LFPWRFRFQDPLADGEWEHCDPFRILLKVIDRGGVCFESAA